MRFVNLTSHKITILTPVFADDSNINLKPSGKVARCEVDSETVNEVWAAADNMADVPVTVTRTTFGEVYIEDSEGRRIGGGLPEKSADDIAYIVSRATAEALPHRNDVYFPNDLVRDANGQVVGCRSLGKVK